MDLELLLQLKEMHLYSWKISQCPILKPRK